MVFLAYLDLLRLGLEGVDLNNLLEAIETDEDKRIFKLRSDSLGRCHLHSQAKSGLPDKRNKMTVSTHSPRG